MSIDFYIHKGNSHPICQDYALVGEDWGVLSDGCSSSPHTEFGAQLLCHAFKGCQEEKIELPRNVSIGVQAWCKAFDALKILHSEKTCLDATLLWLKTNPDGIWTNIVGDGMSFARNRHSHAWIIYYFHHPREAPKYLNYLLSPEREAQYYETYGNEYIKDTLIIPSLNSMDIPYKRKTTFVNYGFQPFSFFFDKENYDLVGIASDGLTSFLTHHQTTVPLEEVFIQFLSPLKNTNGKFLERRGNKFFNVTTQQLDWSHYDDISLVIATQ